MKPTSSLRRKVSSALFAATGLALASVAAAVWIFEYRAADLRARAVLESLAGTMTPGIVASLDFDASDVAAENLRRLEPGGMVLAATVFRTDTTPGQAPRLFASYLRPGATTLFAAQPREAGYLRHDEHALLTQVIRTEGQAVGLLQLEADIGPFRRSLYESLATLAIAFAVLALVAIWTSRLLQNTLTRPLLRLASTVAHVHTHGDYGARAEITTRDEVGHLAEGINLMLAGIEQRDRQLAEQTAFQRAVLENAGVSIISADTAGIIRTFNATSERMLGYAREEVVGRCTPEIFFARDEMVRRAHELSAQLGRDIAPDLKLVSELSTLNPGGFEWVYRRKDGAQIPVFLVLSDLLTADGKFLGRCGIATDLTERKAAAAAVRASEERMRQSFEASPIALALSDQAGAVLYLNRKFTEWFGYTIGDIPRVEIWYALAYPDPVVRERNTQVWNDRLAEAATRGGAMEPMEAEVACRDGRRRLIEFHCQQFAGLLLVAFTDITERKAAEDALRASEEQFKLLTEHAPDAIVLFDLDLGAFVSANTAAERLFGRSRAELMHCSVLDFSPPQQPDGRASADKARELLAATAAGATRPFEWHYQRPDGRIVIGETHLLRLPQPDRILIRGSVTDITERKAAEEALRLSQARLEAAQAQAHIGNWELDLATHSGFWSRQMFRILDLEPTAPSPAYDAFMEMVHPDDRERLMQAHSDVLATGNALTVEFRLRSASGRICHLEANIGVTRDDSGRPKSLTGTLQDITERKRAEEEIRRLNAELEQRVRDRTAELDHRIAEVEHLNTDLRASQDSLAQAASRLQESNANLLAANQELESFSYSVSHDLRAPLRNIAGFIELLRKRTASQLDSEADRYFSIIGTEAVRMAALIDDLLTFSRIGRAELHFAPVQLATLVAEVQSELQSDLTGRQIEWRLQPMPPVLGDRTLLRQVIANLLANAVKFTRQRQPAIIEIGVRPASTGAELLTFYIRDNGAGFDPKYAHKLFGVFQRLHNPRDFEGTGIGLANVKRIINRHGGHTWADGAPNQGATFFFSLKPAAQ